MKRTRGLTTHSNVSDQRKIQILSALLGRTQLMAQLGMQYDGDRDVYQALGYPTSVTFEMYAAKYARHDIAKAVINRPVHATWQGDIQIVETNDQEETEFEKSWKQLWLGLKLKSKFVRLDKLSSMGKYGILLMGYNDVNSVDSWSRPVSKGTRKLLYVKPLSEGSAKIQSYESDTSNERYGLPRLYDVTLKNPDGTSQQQVRVHYSRVIHVAGDMMESEVEGTPVLQAVYNRLMDLDKLVGGSAEMFWRGARPGFQGEVNPEFTLTQEVRDALREQWDEYEHNLRRVMVNEGVKFSPLEVQVSDPRQHVDVQIQMISAVTGIPKRILIGSERGELASSEDKGSWLELIQGRQRDYAEPQILNPFIESCMDYGVLPQSSGYHVVWPDLYSPSEKERADIGQTRASALMNYMNNPAAEIVFPPELFIEFMLGLDENDIEYVRSLLPASMDKELEQMRATLVKPTAAPPKIGTPARDAAAGQPQPTVQDEDGNRDVNAA